MRTVGIIGLIISVVCAPAATFAQPGKYSAAVILPEIELRAGPSWKIPTTGKLKKGEQLIVHHEDGPWIAVLPPPGAMSWVNHRFLGEFDANNPAKQNALIMADNVEIRVGSEKGGPLGVTQVKLPRGTWVEIIGPKFDDGPKDKAGTSTWYPITPPEGEYRWLPKEALGPPSPIAPPPVFVKSGTTPSSTMPGIDKTPGTLTSSGGAISVNTSAIPQWDQAEQAERAGNFALAEKLYTSIYQSLRQKNSDPEQLLVCYNRIIKCQDRLKPDGANSRLVPQPAINTGSGSKSTPPASLLPPTNSNAAPVVVAWPSDPVSSSTPSSPSGFVATKGSAASNGQRTSGQGNLRKTQFTIDGKQAYALENERGQVLYYATAAPGVSLDGSVNKQVELQGSVQVRGDVRGAEYMVVSQVNLK